MKVKVNFADASKKFSVHFTENKQHLPTKFKGMQPITEYIGGERYDGAYEVTPKVEAQTLPTKDKVLIEDVTVKGIEIHRVKNSSGGTTVYIAKGV